MSTDQKLIDLSLAQVNYTQSPSKFLTNTFATEIKPSDNISVQVDLVKEGIKTLPFIKRGQSPTRLETEKFSTGTYAPPLIKVELPLPANIDTDRIPGESIANQYTPEQRRQYRINRELMLLNKRADAVEEAQMAEGMFTGVITTKDQSGTVNATIDLIKKPTHLITVANLWNSASADPLNNLMTACGLNEDDSDIPSTHVIFGWEAFLAMLQVEKVSKIFDSLNIKINEIEAAVRQQSAVRIGVLGISGLEGWVINTSYRDFATGLRTKHLDPKKVWVGSILSPKTRYFARVEHKMAPSLSERFAYIYETEDKSSDIIGFQTAPLAVDNMPDASTTLTVL
jgi:hypothetical protein